MIDDTMIHRLMTQSGCGGTLTPAVRRFAQACAAVGADRFRFAGWFSELHSGMSYRLWEQGGHDQEPGEIALYERTP